MADVTVSPDSVVVVSGLSDTDDGIKLKVDGDEFYRVHLTPQGEVLVGDGTAAPTSVTAYDNTVSELEAETYQEAIDELAAAIAAL